MPARATVALDYRLVLDRVRRAARRLVSILDGDRDLRLDVACGDVDAFAATSASRCCGVEPSGTWVNRASLTAAAEKLVDVRHGLEQMSSGSTLHLARASARRRRRTTVDNRAGRALCDSGDRSAAGARDDRRHVRPLSPRPPVWPWLLGAVSLARSRSSPRAAPAAGCGHELATVLGLVAGLAALAGLVSFDAADAPNGRVAWAQIVLGVRPRSRRRQRVSSGSAGVGARTSAGSSGVAAAVGEPRLASRLPARGRHLAALARTRRAAPLFASASLPAPRPRRRASS